METVRTALALVTVTLRDVAGWLGTTYNSTRAWRLGNRNPSPSVQRKLAAALRRHAQRLLKAASALDRDAERRSK